MDPLGIALRNLKSNNLPPVGFEKAWPFVKTAVKLKRPQCQVKFLYSCCNEDVFPKFIVNSTKVEWLSDKNYRMRIIVRRFRRELLVEACHTQERREVYLEAVLRKTRRELWSMPKEQYLIVKEIKVRAEVAEWTRQWYKMKRKLDALRPHGQTLRKDRGRSTG